MILENQNQFFFHYIIIRIKSFKKIMNRYATVLLKEILKFR